jgi:cell wall-associated NlpC family hydrolase
MATRSQIQTKAREFIGTPFKSQHRMKGPKGGVDCVGIVLLVAEELGIAYKDTQEMRGLDYINYPIDGIGGFVLQECNKRLMAKPISQAKPGDVVVMRVPDVPCHAGILTDVGGVRYMVHAFNSGPEKVVEHILDFKWERRIVGCFEYPGTTEG